jgi:hypothetical protein
VILINTSQLPVRCDGLQQYPRVGHQKEPADGPALGPDGPRAQNILGFRVSCCVC